ncbi:MAG: tetratricopeptide repeat protein, partial [Bryobacteraceae bacterium]
MLRTAFLVALLASAASAADWTEYRVGPFRVVSNAGDRAARERLTQMEQTRHVLAGMLGKTDLPTVWPIVLVLFPNQKEYGPHALPQPFVPGGSSDLSAWMADTPQPLDWRREVVHRLIADNGGSLSGVTVTALEDLFSTIEVNATRVKLGAPLPAGVLPPDRLRAWAKIQLLATNPEYAGRFRVYLSNLENGNEESVAARNGFDLSLAELNKRADAYFKAGVFEASPVFGEALNPNRDFIEKRLTQSDVTDWLDELKAAGKTFPPTSPRGLLAAGTAVSLEQAGRANPRWAEPHVRLAELETNKLAKVTRLKEATALEPQNSAYWQALAEAQTDAGEPIDAAKSWISAERTARSDAERARIHEIRMAAEQRRIDAELADTKRAADERAADLQRVKDAAAAEIRAAEAKANREQGGLKSNATPVPFAQIYGSETVTGTLVQVECPDGPRGGPRRLTIQNSKSTVKVLVRGTEGLNPADFACGVQKPPRQVMVIHDAKPDAKLGTIG